MSRSGLPHDVVEYPCSDGTPMGESDIWSTVLVAGRVSWTREGWCRLSDSN